VNARQIVYVFHGMGGNAEFVNQYPNLPLSQELRTTMGDETPLFIGLSTGQSGALSYNASIVFQKGLAEIESRAASGAVASRHLIGLSMGGHNATRLAAEGGASAFRSVSLLCPALMPTEDPHDNQEVAAYRARHAAYLDANFFGVALGLFRRTFPTRSDWQANSPFELLRSGRFDGLQFFLSTGEQDNLGLIEGTLAWKNESEGRRIPAKMENLAGSHCVFNNRAFVDFVRAVL